MGTSEYFLFLYDHLWLYVSIVISIYILYVLLFRRYCKSLIDPLTLMLFFSANAASTPIFLFITSQITVKYFVFFIITQITFFIGFLIIPPIKVNTCGYELEKKEVPTQVIIILFVIITILNNFTQLLSYYLFEIPIFAESRITVYGESGGYGQIFNRILNITYPCSILLTIYFIIKGQGFIKKYALINIIVLLIFTVLKGAKSGFMIFATSFFIYSMYSTRWGNVKFYNNLKKYSLKFLLFASLIAVLVILISNPSDNPLFFLLIRLGMSGDIYYMTYPNDIIELIPKSSNWVLNLFSGPLSSFGFVDRSLVPEPMGFFLSDYHTSGVITNRGPNARMSAFAYVYIGYFSSFLYSFFIGFIFSYIRNILFYKLPQNILGCMFYFLLLSFAIKLEPDFHTALSDLVNIIFIFLPIVVFTIIFSNFLTNAKTSFNNNSNV